LLPQKEFLLVDFYADWCEPCKWAEPILDEVIKNFNGKLVLHKLNIDTDSDVARQFHIMSVPTLVLLKNGIEIWRMKGFEIAPKLYATLKIHLE
jgi:thioredoxin 1